MKKLNAKLVISTIVAVAMASMTAITAGAAGYGDGAAPTTTTPVATTLTTAAVKEAIAEAIADGEDEILVVAEADATTGKVTVSESIIAELIKNDVTATFTVTPEDGIPYAVTIDPSTITGDAAKINIGMNIIPSDSLSEEVTMAAAAMGVEIPTDALVIAPQTKGEFGMELTVTIPAAVVGDVDEDSVFLYYLGDDLTLTKLDGQLVVNADGSVSVTISHASAYIIATEDLGGDADEDEDEDEDDNDASLDDEDLGDDDSDVAAAADNNPGTGVGLAVGALAASAAAVVITAKKRK